MKETRLNLIKQIIKLRAEYLAQVEPFFDYKVI